MEARSGWLRVSVGGVGEVEAEVMRVDVRVRRYVEHSFMMNTIGLFEVLILHAEVMNRSVADDSFRSQGEIGTLI